MNKTFLFPVIAWPVLAWAASALVACGGSSSSNGPSNDGGSGADSAGNGSEDGGGNGSDGGSVSAPQACADLAQARCKQWDACSNATYTTLHYGSQSACVSATEQSCALGLAASGTAQNPMTIEACAQATATESCADLFGVNPPAACAPPAGPAAAGTPCFAAAQCASTYCAVPDTATCGTCAPVPQAGASCTVTADCGNRGGLICSDLGTCVALGASSAACDKDNPCGPDLSCVGANAKKGTKGTCQAAVATVGATCDATQQTSAGCDATLGLKCDLATSQCVADTLVAASATCGDLGGGVVGKCEANGTCVLSESDAGADGGDAGAVATTGTCLASAPTGSPCDTVNGPACALPGKCASADGGTSGTCQIVDPTICK